MTPRFVFFGTPKFAAIVLDELEEAGYPPSLIVTAPPKPKGRHLILTPSEVEEWAKKRQVPVLAPARVKGNTELFETLKRAEADVFIVAAYGKILPQELLDIPPHGTLNVHPSILPKFRGPSPIESAILSDEIGTGVTIMLLDVELDHGDILAQEAADIGSWPPKASELEETLARGGGKLLARMLAPWVEGKIVSTPQDHTLATHTKKISKEDGRISISDPAMLNLKKVKAYDLWPGAWMMAKSNGSERRIKITEAHIDGDQFVIDRVIPEGKKEMPYADFLRGASA